MNSVDLPGPGQQSPKSGSEISLSLTRRRHTAGLRELGEREWSVPLGQPPLRWFVPLGSAEAGVAQRAAQAAAHEVVTRGWERAGSTLAREFTLALSWLETPMAWTYVSLFTLPRPAVAPVPNPTGLRLRVALIEPDAVFRTAVSHWLTRIPGVTCQGWPNEQTWFTQPRRRTEFDILLVNRLAPAFVAGRFKSTRSNPGGNGLVFGYGIYPTSDDIFVSVSGVDAGYFLRRRTLMSVLEPLSAAFSGGQLVPAEVSRALRRYFQNLFTLEAETSTAGGLTTRERQILACIQRGLRDKEIATSLGISPLTVHTHLKHVFHKLGAHTRTEAVVKYLEK